MRTGGSSANLNAEDFVFHYHHRDGFAPLFGRALPEWKSVPDYCAGCARYETCRGGCRAASEQYYGSAALADPYLELDRD